MPNSLDGAPDALAAGHPLCHFIPHSGCSGRLRPIYQVLPLNPKLLAYPPPPTIGGLRWGYDSCILCWCRCRDVRGVGEAGKRSLLGPFMRLRGPNRLTTDDMGFKAGSCPYAPLHPCAPPALLSLPPSLCLDTKERRGQKKGESKSEKGK
jgi:hypothetical protein